MQFENQPAVIMLLLIIILFYFNDLINSRLTHTPKSSFKTKMNPSINKLILMEYSQELKALQTENKRVMTIVHI